jgi:diacylglycerol kinase family enzyme
VLPAQDPENKGIAESLDRKIADLARFLPDGPAMTQLVSSASSAPRPFAHRAAFLLNKNARAVSDRLVERLAHVVPAGDLFLSRSVEDAEVFARTIVRRGYGRVFMGGGDGTLVMSMNLIKREAAAAGVALPTFGVLKLGTGNAMATALGAAAPLVDANHVVAKGDSAVQHVDFVQCEDGTLTPFAGMGYDGAVLNDYVSLKEQARSPLARSVAHGLSGYLGAMLFRSVPKELRAPPTHLRIKSKHDAVFMRSTPQGDVEEVVPAGTVLFEGEAATVSLGAIPFYGYGFKMFPFAMTKPGHIQLRVVGAPIPAILANLWPKVWNGTWRHEKVLDFLVRDVEVESDRPLPYQVGGDAAGHKTKLGFQVADTPMPMARLATERLVPAGHTMLQLGPARMLLRLPR